MTPKLTACLWVFFLTEPVLGQNQWARTCVQVGEKKALLPCAVLQFLVSVHSPHVISTGAKATGAKLPPVAVTPAWLRATQGPARSSPLKSCACARTPCHLGAQQDFSGPSSSPRALTVESWPHLSHCLLLRNSEPPEPWAEASQ